MTVESDLYDTLKGLVSNRAFPDFAPVATVRPYITYQQVGGEAIGFMERAMPSKKNGLYQVNVWGDNRAQCAALILQVEQALVTATVFQATAERAPISEFDADVPVYGAHQDFSIWSDR